ncbi:MAG TPA: hypothetical protein PKX92_04475 [Edaphocola sp.]|nr:hypothetical protein [Edaphocola sp.]
MKLILLFGVLFCSTAWGQSYNKQHTYIDALELSNIYNQSIQAYYGNYNELIEPFYKILFNYGLSKNKIYQNIFFEGFIIEPKYMAACCEPSTQPKNESYIKSNNTVTTLSPSLWQAAALNGLATFMAGRFKQEALQIAIDQTFRQIKKREDSLIIKSIFPKTFSQISNLYGNGGASYYTADLLLLRQTAQLDIDQLPENLSKNFDLLFPILNKDFQSKDLFTLAKNIEVYSKHGLALNQLISHSPMKAIRVILIFL